VNKTKIKLELNSQLKVTFVDFIVYEVLDQQKILSAECLKDFPNLEEFLQRIESREKIAAFLKSPKFIKHPLNGRMAYFGGDAR